MHNVIYDNTGSSARPHDLLPPPRPRALPRHDQLPRRFPPRFPPRPPRPIPGTRFSGAGASASNSRASESSTSGSYPVLDPLLVRAFFPLGAGLANRRESATAESVSVSESQ